MAQPGLRILSLDGGGTRVLSTLYILREIMDAVTPGMGGHTRPCEYFDMIGGSGLNGLCALLFVRFCLTVDNVIDYLRDLSGKLDMVEQIQQRVRSGQIQNESLKRCVDEFDDPTEQLEALRQGIVQDAWQAVIKENIVEFLERYPHMENGTFDFKNPSAKVEAARTKALVVSSEAPGYGINGGMSDAHMYNVPILHRTYACRHEKTLYSLYEVGLATVASPGIMKPGVIFPHLLATGKHTVHQPVRLLLEESNKLWPGLRVMNLTSIGTGTFELTEEILRSFSSNCAEACLRILNENRAITDDIRRFVLPYATNLDSAFLRFDLPERTPFFEYSESHDLLSKVRNWLVTPPQATKCAIAAAKLGRDDFPSLEEDQVALSSFSSLLQALLKFGYAYEAELVADIISNFILYESTGGYSGSFRKMMIATNIEKLAGMLRGIQKAYESQDTAMLESDLRTEGMILNGLATFGNDLPGGPRDPRSLHSLSDYVAGASSFLAAARREDQTEMREARFQNLLDQLSNCLDMAPKVTQKLLGRVHTLLELTTAAALCEAGTIELLRGCKRILYNGVFVRHLYKLLAENSLGGINLRILNPIANAIALLIRMKNWTWFRNRIIAKLLYSVSTVSEHDWSFVSLALELLGAEKQFADDDRVLPACVDILSRNTQRFVSLRSEVAILSMKYGYFSLLRKCLRKESLLLASPKPGPNSYRTTKAFLESTLDSNGNTLFHLGAKLGFPMMLALIAENLGSSYREDLINVANLRGQTPLHLACMNRAPDEVFGLLFLLRADINARCKIGRTPLHYCFPDNVFFPATYKLIVGFVEEYSLPTTIPLHDRGEYGITGQINPRLQRFRAILKQLCHRKADISLQDNDGMTPLHLAAKEGWGNNLDIFFTQRDTDIEQMQDTSLRLQENTGATVLDYSRTTGVKDGLSGGEDIIVAEMRKRGMEVPPRSVFHGRKVEHECSVVTMGKSRQTVQGGQLSSDSTPHPTLSSPRYGGWDPAQVYGSSSSQPLRSLVTEQAQYSPPTNSRPNLTPPLRVIYGQQSPRSSAPSSIVPGLYEADETNVPPALGSSRTKEASESMDGHHSPISYDRLPDDLPDRSVYIASSPAFPNANNPRQVFSQTSQTLAVPVLPGHLADHRERKRKLNILKKFMKGS